MRKAKCLSTLAAHNQEVIPGIDLEIQVEDLLNNIKTSYK